MNKLNTDTITGMIAMSGGVTDKITEFFFFLIVG